MLKGIARLVFFIVLPLFYVTTSYAYEPLTADEFLENKLLIDTAISPNGKFLATVWYVDESNTNIVTVQDLTKASKPIIATINERITLPQLIYWASNERMIMKLNVPKFLNDAKKELADDPENFNVYNFRTQSVTVSVNHLGKDLVQLHRASNGDLLNIIRDMMRGDPEHIMMENWHNGKRELLKVNIITGEGKVITSGGDNTKKFLTDEKGHPLYRVDYLPISKAYEIFNYKNGDWNSIDRVRLSSISDEVEGDFSSYNSKVIGINNNQLIYLKANESTGFKEVITIDTKTLEKKTLVSLIDKDVSGIITSRRSSDITGYRFIDKDVMRRVYFDKQKQSINEKVLAYFPYDGYSLFGWNGDKDKWIIKSNGANERAFYLYNAKLNELEHYSNTYKTLLPENLGLPASITYSARDKIKIRSYMLLPPTYKKGTNYPLIMLPHGGPLSRDYSTFDLLAQFLSTRGFIVLQPNFRGSSGYGKEFQEMGYKQWGETMQDDLEDGVNFLIKRGYADKERVCIVGGSYGGYAALMGLIKTPDLYQCAVSINGVTDIEDMIKYKNKVFRKRKPILEYIENAYGNLDDDQAYFKRNSPINHVDKIIKPVLIMAGELDNVVEVNQSTSFVDALEDAGKEVEAYYSKWSGHNLFYYSNCRKESYKKIESFLSKHLDVKVIVKSGQLQSKKKTNFWGKEREDCLQSSL